MNFESYRFLIPRLWPDVVEILLVAFVIYRFLLFLVGTRAMQIVVGVMILSVAYFAALVAKFQMISFLLSVVFTYGAFAVVVVFQPELRNALARLGQSRLMRRFSQGDRQSVAEEIAEAMDRLSRAGTGALIAVEGDIDAGTIASNTFEIEWPPKSGRLQTFPEIDRAGWFDLPTAHVKIIESQRLLLDRLMDRGANSASSPVRKTSSALSKPTTG